MKKEFEKHMGKTVVLDTPFSWLYIGKLAKILSDCVVLTEADAHDTKDTGTSKEVYIFETRKTGVKANREKVYVSFDHIVSFSDLEDIKSF